MRALLVVAMLPLAGCATKHTQSVPTDSIPRLDALVAYAPNCNYAFEHEPQLGQLSKTQVNLIPYVPQASIRSETISDAVYAEVMKNKWRAFRGTWHVMR